MSSAGVVALNHVGVSVADLDRARAFWVDGLGAADHGSFAWPVGTSPADESLATQDTAAAVMLLRTDTAFLELFAFSSPIPVARPAASPGVAALAWAVPDVAAVRARLGLGADEPVRCPDGTPVELRAADGGPTGLIGVTVRVGDPASHPLAGYLYPRSLPLLVGVVAAVQVMALLLFMLVDDKSLDASAE